MAPEHYSLDEKFTIRGHWWRPGGQHRPAGDLSYDERKLELHLLGAFDDAEGQHPFERALPVTEPAVIHGESAKGTPITLLGSFYTHWQPGGGLFSKPPVPIVSSKLTCNAMLLGIHLETEDKECFTRCSLMIPNLDRWLDDRPFDIQINHPETVNVTYTRPEERRFAIPECIGDFRFCPVVTPPICPSEDVTIRHWTYVRVDPDGPKNFTWFVRIANEIERLFTLLMGRVVQATETRLMCDGDEDVIDSYVYLPRERIHQPEMDPIDFLLRYPDITDWFPGILKSWFRESGKIRHALDLVFSSLQKPGRFLETRFLPFVQAVEVLCRAVEPGQIVDKRVYGPIRKEIIRSIPEDTPEELREAIVRSLGYANERTLRERFVAILGGLKPETTELFCVNPTDFVRGVVETRNYLTHYSGRSESVLRGMQLHWATVKLQTMMRVLLLKRLGIPESGLLSLLKKNHGLSNERRTWQEVPELGSSSGESDA